MSDISHEKLRSRDREMIPRVLVRATAILCVSVLLIVTYAVLTDRPLSATPPSETEVPVVAERVIRIFGEMDGSARVTDLDGNVIATLEADQGGFVSGIYRVLDRERGAVGHLASDPIRLVRHSDGRIGLRDPLTDFRAELVGFGADNTRVFARLLEE